MERAGQVLRRTELVYSNLCWSQDTAELRELEAQINPRLAAHADQIWLNATLFRRIQAIGEEAGLGPEETRLVRRYHLDFVRAGAALEAAAAERLTQLNQELAALTTAFAQQLLAINSESALVVNDVAELDGLTEPDIDAAADAARAAGHPSGYLIGMVAPTVHPFLGRLTNRETRRRLWEAGHDRGLDGAHRTLPLAAQIARRAQRDPGDGRVQRAAVRRHHRQALPDRGRDAFAPGRLGQVLQGTVAGGNQYRDDLHLRDPGIGHHP